MCGCSCSVYDNTTGLLPSWSFSGDIGSHIRFSSSGYFSEAIRHSYLFSFDFKTTENDGVMLYYAELGTTDFTSVYFQNGTITHANNDGDILEVLSTSNTYNDGLWHTIKAGKQETTVLLIVDDEYLETPTSAKNRVTTVQPTVFIGGFWTSQSPVRVVENLVGFPILFISLWSILTS